MTLPISTKIPDQHSRGSGSEDLHVLFGRKKTTMVESGDAISGRSHPEFQISGRHAVLKTLMTSPFPEGSETAIFGLGCFWGAERLFWQTEGVISTAVGYAGGFTENPTYEEVCSGRTGHTEAVLVVFDPKVISFESLLRVFWEEHNPTQGMRQGNDVGTQYRSAIYTTTVEQARVVAVSRDAYQLELKKSGYGEITTEITSAGPFYYAEEYHQQYLHKIPHGYCGLAGTGVGCPIGMGVGAAD